MAQTDLPVWRSPNRRHERQFFYKYVTASVAKTILSTRTIRWSSPLIFNDPFDVTQELRLNFDEAELNKVVAEELALLIEERGNPVRPVSPPLELLLIMVKRASKRVVKEVVDNLRRYSSTPTGGQIEAIAMLKQTWSNLVPNFRILCLSELKDVTSMWLHYSDSYRGAVLEFECVDELDSALLLARPVTYQEEAPRIADKREWAHCMLGRTKKTYSHLFTDLLYVKTTAWSYEREWRIATSASPQETGLYTDYSFNPREITGIYLGELCSGIDQADILSLLTDGLQHVSAYRALAHGVKSKFTFQRIR